MWNPLSSPLVLVGAGGCIGAIARYTSGRIAKYIAPESALPLATIFVNLSGCFLIGFVAGCLADTNRERTELFLITGVLGGFTTFSSFGIEIVEFLHKESYEKAILYPLSKVIAGVALAALGFALSVKLVR